MLNTAACVCETKAFYVVMLLELTDKWKTTKESKKHLQKEIDKLTFVLKEDCIQLRLSLPEKCSNLWPGPDAETHPSSEIVD